ncbi:MAG: hypothetical protein GY696_04080 [Gammaproteobacteria bacterium]|nr:hypothetical protein [Gammaproteobacteria bacterium]
MALLRRVQPTQPEAYIPTIEKLVESLRGASHFGPMHLIPREPVPEERGGGYRMFAQEVSSSQRDELGSVWNVQTY